MNFLKDLNFTQFKDILGSQKVWTIVIVDLTLWAIGAPKEKIIELTEVALPALLLAHGIQTAGVHIAKKGDTEVKP